MPKLANISGKEAVRAFTKAGYTHVHTSGDHAILQKAGFPTLSIPPSHSIEKWRDFF